MTNITVSSLSEKNLTALLNRLYQVVKMYLLGIKRMISPRFRSILVALVGSGDTSKPNHHSKQKWIPVRGKKGMWLREVHKAQINTT